MRIVVIGTGGLGRETMEVVKRTERVNDALGFLDDNPMTHGTSVNGYPVLGGVDWLKNNKIEVLCGIGDNHTRRKVTLKAISYGAEFTTVVHPNADIGDTVPIGLGTIVTSGNTITCNIKIKEHVFINLDCTIGHDSVLEDDTIDTYNQFALVCRENGDSTSMKIFEEIIDEEQIHFNYFDSVHDHIEKLGDTYLSKIAGTSSSTGLGKSGFAVSGAGE